MSNALIFTVRENAAIIRFNRPQIRSPLSIFVLEELREIIESVAENKSIETLVFTGQNDVFASGADLREIAETLADKAREFAERGQNLMSKIAALNQTTVAAINGFCFGGALDLALACDSRIAASSATFAHPGANLGIITGWGGTQRLPRLVGESVALEMFFLAKRVGADEALRIGLIDAIADSPLEYSIANRARISSSIRI